MVEFPLFQAEPKIIIPFSEFFDCFNRDVYNQLLGYLHDGRSFPFDSLRQILCEGLRECYHRHNIHQHENFGPIEIMDRFVAPITELADYLKEKKRKFERVALEVRLHNSTSYQRVKRENPLILEKPHKIIYQIAGGNRGSYNQRLGFLHTETSLFTLKWNPKKLLNTLLIFEWYRYMSGYSSTTEECVDRLFNISSE